jgi:arabinan endo-1,5-alpha-L-arabinosidase
MTMARPFVLLSIAMISALISAHNSPAPPGGDGAANAVQFVHDPCIIKDGVYIYVYATGPGIPIRRSKDLIRWETRGSVFEGTGPDWIRRELPESRGMWAPDIYFRAGRFHLTYAVSRFGSNHSLIGAASNKTLDPESKDYQWLDEGKVFESTRQDNFNAIDPNILPLSDGRLALTFGSFWSGIKLVVLDAKTGKPVKNSEVLPLARRPSPDAIEAPFLIRRGRTYYLFVSFDYCCRGVNSTYNIRVGRAESVTGPYLDRDGKPMMDGGGTPVVATEGSRIGPGHCAVLHDGRKDYLAYHYYDGTHNGVPTLQICPLTWSRDGWPIVGQPLGDAQ